MIDIDRVLQDLPKFTKFCSVGELDDLVERLRSDPRFVVQRAGDSAGGHPIHHVRFGQGSVKALIVGFPHPMEPIGGLTVTSLMSLLLEGHPALVAADVEWNIVPCIDPDGAKLNEAWTQDFSFERFLRNYYLQSARDQADMSFPIAHKKLVVDAPSTEARVLKSVIDTVMPDFYFTLHNTRFGGAFYLASHDIGQVHYDRLHALLRDLDFPLQKRAPWKEVGARYADGVGEVLFTKKIYDYLETVTPAPELYELIRYGGESWDYLEEVKPSALTFVAEMGCLRHPDDESEVETDVDLRWLQLRIDAESKYLATVLLDEWDALQGALDPANPFYRSIVGGTVLPRREEVINGGWPMSRYPTAEILTNPAYARRATRSDLLNVLVVDGGLYFVQWAYQFLRLLLASAQTAAVEASIARTERAFDRFRAEVDRHLDTAGFSIAAHDTLARVQLGSGLIALNAVLAGPRE